MATIEQRLAALREYLKNRTKQDAFTYLREHGAYTPDGRRIALYPHPIEGIDPLSLSLYQMLDEAIETGRLDLPEELESDLL